MNLFLESATLLKMNFFLGLFQGLFLTVILVGFLGLDLKVEEGGVKLLSPPLSETR